MLIASRYQHPFTTNEVEGIKLQVFVTNLMHLHYKLHKTIKF